MEHLSQKKINFFRFSYSKKEYSILEDTNKFYVRFRMKK